MHSVEKVGEDAATLSRLSDGRFALGVALGYRDAEFDGFGLRRKDRGRTLDVMLPRLAGACSAVEPPVPLYLPLFADSTMNVQELREILAAYEAARVAAGAPKPATHALQRDVFVTEDRERDWAMLFPELRYMRRQYGAWSNPQQPGEPMPAYLERLESDIEAKLKNLVMGTPKEVAAKLREFEALGFDLIVCRSQYGNLPRADLRRAIELLGKVPA
jgi:alkanesulfonate monooxygenase SsuD/methylene tetrahydromethanopterin reductase-like flavin-dependent oxidoreductase (luciferase family)